MDTPIPVFICKCANTLCGRTVQLKNVRSTGEARCFLIDNYWKPIDLNGRASWLCPACVQLLPPAHEGEPTNEPRGPHFL
jgi:hypothetical protein